MLRRYPWPGNVRELQSVLKQALLRAQGPVLLADFLPASVRGEEEPAGTSAAPFDWEGFLEERLRAGSQDLYAEALALMERSLLTRVLRHTRGNQLQAAKILGITRGSLRTKIRTLGITIERSVWSAGRPAGPLATRPPQHFTASIGCCRSSARFHSTGRFGVTRFKSMR